MKKKLISPITCIGLFVLLIVIDQGVKLYISHQYTLSTIIDIAPPFFYFRPFLNTDLSWFGSMFSLDWGIAVYMFLFLIIFIFVVCAQYYVYKENINRKLIQIMFIFVYAGGACSIIDKLFWGGSLDFIWLKGFFIFDLKDLYVDVFILLLFINYRHLKDLSFTNSFRLLLIDMKEHLHL